MEETGHEGSFLLCHNFLVLLPRKDYRYEKNSGFPIVFETGLMIQ